MAVMIMQRLTSSLNIHSVVNLQIFNATFSSWDHNGTHYENMIGMMEIDFFPPNNRDLDDSRTYFHFWLFWLKPLRKIINDNIL